MRRTGVLVAGAALVLAGCSAPSPPEVTFYTDGDAAEAAPLIHCDVEVQRCEQGGQPAVLKSRPGMPVQISVPGDVSDAPWTVNIQYTNADGELQPVRQEFFGPGTRHAYTAVAGPAEQLVVVEVQQLGAAYAADQAGNPILDEAGNPQLVARAIWSLQVEPA